MINYPLARQTNIVVQELKDETLIYDLTNNKAYLLNETSAFVLNQCDGKTDVSTIAESLAKIKRQPVNEEIVWLAIEQLKENNLLKEAALPNEFIKSNRREMIRRIGLATMLALPLVSSVTAPKAIQAASSNCSGTVCAGVQGGCCSNAGDTCCGSFCCSGNDTCCGSICCSGAQTCCGSFCCNVGSTCCGSTCCQAPSFCCGSVCCDASSSRCINGICVPSFP